MNRENFPKPNAECIICGRKYYRCARCIELRDRGIEAWKLKCDTFNCFAVHCLLENIKKNNTDDGKLDELLQIELPDGREYTAETAKEIENIKNKFTVLQEEVANENEFKAIDFNDAVNTMPRSKQRNKRNKTQNKAKNVK